MRNKGKLAYVENDFQLLHEGVKLMVSFLILITAVFAIQTITSCYHYVCTWESKIFVNCKAVYTIKSILSKCST